jgi:hypothetical protein
MHTRIVTTSACHLETTEWIVVDFEIIKEATSSVGLVSSTGAPLAATSPATVHACFRSIAASVLGVTQGIIDEGFHPHSPHGVKEVSVGRSAGLRCSGTDGTTIGVVYR